MTLEIFIRTFVCASNSWHQMLCLIFCVGSLQLEEAVVQNAGKETGPR
jgi:hypothetical protein